LFKDVIIPTFEGGAVLDIRDRSNVLLLHIRGGNHSEREFRNIEKLASKQNHALDKFPQVKSTWVLRDQPEGYTTGGIRTPHNDRFSISGFSWKQNQNAALWLAQMLRRISVEDADRIAALCGERLSFIEQHRLLTATLDKLPPRPSHALV